MKRLLSTSCNIGSLSIKNRIIMEAMGNALSELDGSMSEADHCLLHGTGKRWRWTHYERGSLC